MIGSTPEEVNKFLNKNTDLDSIAEAVPDTFCRSTYQFPVPCPPLETARRFRTLLRKRGDMDRSSFDDQRGAGQALRGQAHVPTQAERRRVVNVRVAEGRQEFRRGGKGDWRLARPAVAPGAVVNRVDHDAPHQL